MHCAVADSERSLEPAAAVIVATAEAVPEVLQPSHSGASTGASTEGEQPLPCDQTSVGAAPMPEDLEAPTANGFPAAADSGLDRAGVGGQDSAGRPGSMYNDSTVTMQDGNGVGGRAHSGLDFQWGCTDEDETGVAWGADETASGWGPAVDPQQPVTTEAAANDFVGDGNVLQKSVTAHTAPKPCGGATASTLTPELSAAVLAVAFPGTSVIARLRRGMVEMLQLRDQFHPVTLAELGSLLVHHAEVGPLWNDPANRLPKLGEIVEETAALVPRALTVDRCGSIVRVRSNSEALRLAALRRAVAAAYPGDDDVSLVRRAAATALVDAESAVMGIRHSLNMPALGVCVTQMATEPRRRLAEARGTAFSLAGVLQPRRSPVPSQATTRLDATSEEEGGGGGGVGYIIMSTVGSTRIASLDADRLVVDAAAGRLGDLASVQPVKPRASVTFTNRTPSAAVYGAVADGSPATALIVPRVKEVLRVAIPDGRPETHAKRCLALLAAASLGGTGPQATVSDPPHTLRSSSCGMLLADIGLKPLKLRALFDEEPHVFKAGKPSPNYLIQLVYEPLLELSTSHPEDLATSVEALLQGRTYPGARFRPTGHHALDSSKAVAAAAAAAAAAADASTAVATAAQVLLVPASLLRGAATSPAAAPRPSAPPGQPSDYYQRLERAILDRLENSSASEFLTRARRVLAMALLRRHAGADGLPRHAILVKDAATVLKTQLPEAYREKRPPGVFPVKAQVLVEQMPLLFTFHKPSANFKDWYIRLNTDSLELSAGLNPTPVPEREAAAEMEEMEEGDYTDEPYSGDANGLHVEAVPAIAAATAEAVEPPPPSAAAVADLLATQPARVLAAALASMVPPDLLPDPKVQIITVPYSHEHVTALSHCLSCPQIGLAAKSVGGAPSIVLLYAPPVDTLKPAAASAAIGVSAPTGILPATVYILDASGAAAAAVAAAGSGVGGGSSDAGVTLLASLRVLLEDPGVAKVVHGCEQLIPMLEHAVGCIISPMLDTRLVSEMLKPLDLDPRLPTSPDGPLQPDEGRAPELWPQPSKWQTALSIKYQDYQTAALHHASGADSLWLTRPLSEGQVGMLLGAVQHLPELWSALTWLLPRLAQFCSIARAQQCRAILGSAVSW